MIEFLKGRKSYVIAILMVLAGLVQFLTGDITLAELLQGEHARIILEGLGLAALRAGVSKGNGHA